MDTVFFLVLLLNSRRPGELQRIPLHLYDRTPNNQQNYKEFDDTITPCENILINIFKRIVIRGKSEHSVYVLFNNDVQDHIKILLDYRKKCLSKNNNFLFEKSKTIEPISGYKILKKYAILSSAINPQAIMATKLQKHLETIREC
ncbi:hypothetical protein WA026_012391 [Henosepilachna vigintioctopunctata]|uniref:Uncharacterized protein n=1 Tax=Henosepilachna vigintioctopunctata TaxID=420089 RepID=A0AAW1UQ04_9CUCU